MVSLPFVYSNTSVAHALVIFPVCTGECIQSEMERANEKYALRFCCYLNNIEHHISKWNESFTWPNDRPKISWYNSLFFFNSSRTNKETQNKTKQYKGKIGNIIENNDGEYKILYSKWSGLPVIYLLSVMISPLAIRHMMAALSNVHNMNPPRILYQMVWWNFHFHNKIRDSAFEMRGKLISNYINRNLI